MTNAYTFSPGIYDGIPLADYRAARGVSHSDLALFSRTPAHYAASLADIDPGETTAARRDGALLHLAILDPAKFGDGVSHHIRPEGIHFSSKDGRAWRDAHPDLPILTGIEHAQIAGARAAVFANPTARALLTARGANEASVFARHPRTGLTLRMRADRLTEDAAGRPWIVDLKSCTDTRKFGCCARERRYDVQSVFSTDALALAGLPGAAFVFIAVEIEPTHGVHAVRLLMIDDETQENARALYESELDRFSECDRAGLWPAHSPDIEYLHIKRWAA
jgi:exodeoxyribonuclease VIII